MKKVISIALALLMVAVMLPVMAMADEPATELPTAQNGVIKLTNNVTLSNMTEIRGNITLDLNGFTISGKGTVLDLYGTIEIKDSSEGGNGKIVSTERTNTPPNSPNSNGIWINNDTSVTINSGTIEGNTWGVVVAGVKASFTMNGGTVINGITGNGSENAGVPVYAPTTITINGGKIIGGGTGIYHPQVGQLTIYNGEITGKTGVEIRAGGLIVHGGTITATGDPTSTDPNGNGTTTVGAAVAIAQHTTKKDIAVTINGGTFTGKAALLESNPQNNGTEYTSNISVNVMGGTFNGAVNKANDASSLDVTGGTFNTDVRPYVDSEFVVTDGNNYYVGDAAQNAVRNATSGELTVLNAGRGVAFNDVKPGVTIVNKSGANIKVNGNEVNLNETYTVPGAPIIIYTPDNEPAFLSGANQVVAPGAAATFRIDEEYDRLLAVAVDGVTLDKSNYEAWSGSTYIKLLPKFMKTLSVGTHTLTAYFTSHTVSTTFTISEGAKNPATGANDFVGVAAAMAVVSLLGAAAVIRKK